MKTTTALRLKCPVCGWTLRHVTASDVATEEHQRTCRKCRAPNTIKTVPRSIPNGMLHIVTFTATRSPL